MRSIYLLILLGVIVLATAGFQISPLVSLNNSAVIPYCATYGYPAAPISTMLKAWYNADSYSPCSGTTESSWTDSSGSGNNATFTAGTFTCNSNQVNGHNALTVSGASAGTIASSLQNPQTVFVVYNITSFTAGANYTFFGGTGGFGLQYRILVNGGATGATQQILRESVAVDMPGLLNVTAATWHQGAFANKPSDAPNTNFLRLDRTPDNSNGATFVGFGNGTNRIFINGNSNNENFVGQVAEMLYYEGVAGSALSSSQVTQNECYLYGKYGI